MLKFKTSLFTLKNLNSEVLLAEHVVNIRSGSAIVFTAAETVVRAVWENSFGEGRAALVGARPFL